MKRARETPCPILLPELWPLILDYLSLKSRYRLLTVCKAWAGPRGAVAQSVTRLNRREARLMHFHMLPNLTSLDTEWTYTLYGRAQLRHLTLCSDVEMKLEELTSLCHLRSFVLNAPFTGLDKSLSRLTTLTSLELHAAFRFRHNSIITGEMLGALPDLHKLTLYNISCPASLLDSLSNLSTLHLLENDYIESESVARLTQLRTLSLVGNANSKRGMLSQLTRLTSLDITHNSVLQDADIEHLTGLISLSIHIRPDLSCKYLSRFSHLTRLVLAGIDEADETERDKLVRHNRIDRLTQVKKLKCLGATGFFVKDAHLATLTQLTSLSIHDIFNLTVSSLSCLTNLTTLKLAYSCLVNFDATRLPVSLRHLNLKHCRVWLSVLDALPKYTNLCTLHLGTLHDEFFDYMRLWDNLTTLTSLKRLHYSGFKQVPKFMSFAKSLPAYIDVLPSY